MLIFSYALLKRIDNKYEMDGLSKTTDGRNIQNSTVAFQEESLDTNGYVPSLDIRSSALYDHNLTNICYEHLVYHVFFFKSFCIRSFGIRSFASYDLLLTIFCLRTSGIRSVLYELLLTIFCPMRSFSYEPLLTDIWHTIFTRTFAHNLLSYDLLP